MLKNAKLISLFPFFLVFYEIANYLANDMYLPALPIIASDLNTTSQAAQETLTLWFLGTSSLQLFLGPLSDRLGRRPLFLVGCLFFIVSTLACAIAPNIDALLLARFFQGCTVCTIVTAGYASIHELYDQTKAIKILAILGSISILAPAFGPLMGGIILEILNWRWIFGILVIWGLVALLLLYFSMPETNPKEQRQTLDWNTLLKNYFSILKNKIFMGNTLIFCLTFLGMIAWIAAGPFLVISTFKYNTLFFGIFQALVFGSLIAGNQAVKYLIDKLGPEKLINTGLGISLTGSIIALILTYIFPNFLFGLVMSLMIFTFGSSLAYSPSHRIAVESCVEPMGARMAIFSTLMSVFGALGSILVSLTYTGTLFWFGCLLLIIACLACLIRLNKPNSSDLRPRNMK